MYMFLRSVIKATSGRAAALVAVQRHLEAQVKQWAGSLQATAAHAETCIEGCQRQTK